MSDDEQMDAVAAMSTVFISRDATRRTAPIQNGSAAPFYTGNWATRFGTNTTDHANGVSADGYGRVYVPGDTSGSLAGRNAGGSDAFVAKYTDVSLAGDYNNNGIVDAADYTVWRDTLGQTGAGLAADGNGDNMVTQLDYDFWKARFGNTSGSGSGQVGGLTIPEPAGLTLMSLALVGFLTWRKRLPRQAVPVCPAGSCCGSHTSTPNYKGVMP